MAACGASPGRAEEVASLEDYSRPLLDAVAGLPSEEKVVLVGHSFGGLSLVLAMECYPDKVAVAVFVAAFMPAAEKPMAIVFEMLSQERQPAHDYMDCKFETSVTGDPQHPVKTFQFGPQYLKQSLYQLSPPEDLTLAVAMMRPRQLFKDDTKIYGKVLTTERYGVVKQVFIIAEDDATLPASFQRIMASLNPGMEVRGVQGADHMPMLSKPKELSELRTSHEDGRQVQLKLIIQMTTGKTVVQDLTLAKTLVRPAQMFLGDEAMVGENVLTEGGYGAVSRVFVVTEEDRTWPAEEQRKAAASCGSGVEVSAIGGANHMPIFSKPAELAQLILEVAVKYC